MGKFIDWLVNSRDAAWFFIGFFLNEAMTQLGNHNWTQVAISVFLVVASIYYIPEKE